MEHCSYLECPLGLDCIPWCKGSENKQKEKKQSTMYYSLSSQIWKPHNDYARLRWSKTLTIWMHTKGGFFSESAIPFSNLSISKEQDSKELSPRSLDKILLKRQVNVQSTQLSNFFKFSKSSKFSKILWIYDFQTCLKLFRFNMIWIVTIHKILKHVWTCSNMSKLVQIKYDTNCYNSYDSQTCLNMFKLV